jgi:hypothetical protein
MNKALLIPRTRRQLILQALAMVAVVEAFTWTLFRYHYHVHMPTWYWPSVTIIGFVCFIALLSFLRWLHQKCDEWSRTTRWWVGGTALFGGVALLIIAVYIRAAR